MSGTNARIDCVASTGASSDLSWTRRRWTSPVPRAASTLLEQFQRYRSGPSASFSSGSTDRLPSNSTVSPMATACSTPPAMDATNAWAPTFTVVAAVLLMVIVSAKPTVTSNR